MLIADDRDKKGIKKRDEASIMNNHILMTQ